MTRKLKLSMAEMAALTAEVERLIKAAHKAAGPIDANDFWARRIGVRQELKADLVTRLKARVNTRHDGFKVTLAGITSSSTSSLEGALTNWLINARGRMITG